MSMTYADNKNNEKMERFIAKWLNRMDETPSVSGQPVALYGCFANKHVIFSSRDNYGFFLLTESHLRFFVDYPSIDPCGAEYAFFDTQIKDITSVCANYMRKNNFAALLGAFLLGALSGALLYFFPDIHSLLRICLYLLLGSAAVTAIGAFTFLRIKYYKIHIGGIHGGFTLMGCQNRKGTNAAAWSQPMTIVYNATVKEEQLLAFIEQINTRISVLQERGEYAYGDVRETLKKWSHL